jgi:hypothetical protein
VGKYKKNQAMKPIRGLLKLLLRDDDTIVEVEK